MPALHRAAAVLGLALFGAAACTPATTAAAGPRPSADSIALAARAHAFMDAYGIDLRMGERERIAERYDPYGAWLVGEGRKRFDPADSIRARYRGRWRPPASFEWKDLSFEAVGPDAVVVTGLFLWGVSAERRITCSYTALLVRREDLDRTPLFHIRLEDESCAPAPPPAP